MSVTFKCEICGKKYDFVESYCKNCTSNVNLGNNLETKKYSKNEIERYLKLKKIKEEGDEREKRNDEIYRLYFSGLKPIQISKKLKISYFVTSGVIRDYLKTDSEKTILKFK